MPGNAPERRRFVRAGEEARRESLIAAALDLVAEGGIEAATVRAIAARAGVTPGLIRHYFDSKEDLIAAAYRDHMDRMTAESAAVLDTASDGPAARLACFIHAALRPPVVDARALGLWSGFLHRVQADAGMRAVHRATYLAFRDRLQDLIAAALPGTAPARLRQLAIAANAVIDGLWLEGSALPDDFAPDELPRLGLEAVGAILGLPLTERMETA
jgi:AcrR family transcriptional regulator